MNSVRLDSVTVEVAPGEVTVRWRADYNREDVVTSAIMGLTVGALLLYACVVLLENDPLGWLPILITSVVVSVQVLTIIDMLISSATETLRITADALSIRRCFDFSLLDNETVAMPAMIQNLPFVSRVTSIDRREAVSAALGKDGDVVSVYIQLLGGERLLVTKAFVSDANMIAQAVNHVLSAELSAPPRRGRSR